MHRRQFLAAGGWAAAAPALARTLAAQPGGGAGIISTRIDFTSDGLGLSPGEYLAHLHQVSAGAELTADNYSIGGSIADLERKFATLLGKQAAMFVPTGTLANHLAIRKLAGNDRRVLVQAESHLYNDSGDGAAALSGLNLVPLAPGTGTIDLAEIQHWVERTAGGRVAAKVGVISLESPVRRMDHQQVDFQLQRISGYAREQGIRMHLDGARMFNLPLHSGRSLVEHAALFDTVYVSLWKHFNAASGAMLAGDQDFIDGLFHERRMFGGSLPHAWPLAAPAMLHLEGYPQQYADAWKAADRLIALLQATGKFKARKLPQGTSRFFLSTRGIAPERFTERVRERDIILGPAHPQSGEFALQVNPTLLRKSPAALAAAFSEVMRD